LGLAFLLSWSLSLEDLLSSLDLLLERLQDFHLDFLLGDLDLEKDLSGLLSRLLDSFRLAGLGDLDLPPRRPHFLGLSSLAGL
jgi:hypothetical protein